MKNDLSAGAAKSCCSPAAGESACCGESKVTATSCCEPAAKTEAVSRGATCCGAGAHAGDEAQLGHAASDDGLPRARSSDEALLAGDADDVRTLVRERYGAVARGDSGAAGCCGGPSCAGDVLTEIGYGAEQAAAIPEGANLGLGCGNPTAHAELRAGETVLDLGSGAGIDCFLAASAVGSEGRVIGVDMTPAMVERAKDNATRGGYANVEFRLGEIERLPVEDASVDVILSNCVVNLSPEKALVFREAHRVLRPGGRLLVSDLVWRKALAPELRHHVDLYVGCVAGASLKDDYLAFIRDAGFRDVEVVREGGYGVGADSLPEGSLEREAFASVASIQVRAIK